MRFPLFRLQLQMQDRKRIALPVQRGTSGDLKSGTEIEPQSGRILFIDVDRLDSEFFQSSPHQPAAETALEKLRSKKQHLQFPVLNSHESGGTAVNFENFQRFDRLQTRSYKRTQLHDL